jgi:hypothetical protein
MQRTFTDTEKFIGSLGGSSDFIVKPYGGWYYEKALTPVMRLEGSDRTTLLGQSHEVLHEIFRYVYPQDLGSLSRTCLGLSTYIKNNRLLWRDVYLQNFDEPKPHVENGEPQWEQDAKGFVTFLKLCQTSSTKKAIRNNSLNLEVAANSIIKLASNARIVPEEYEDEEESRNLRLLRHFLTLPENVETFSHNSNLYQLAHNKPENRTKELSQLLAKVHCLAGTGCDQFVHNKSERQTRMTRRNMAPDAYARSRVYDLRLYNGNNKWGPWSDDGKMKVDWEKLECIMIDLAYNVEAFTAKICTVLKDLWQEPFVGVQHDSYVDAHPCTDPRKASINSSSSRDSGSRGSMDSDDLEAEMERALIEQDPYGVTGTWQRIVCFLDYSDFYYINFSSNPPLSQHRPPVDREEAIRLILMELKVTKIEPVEGSPLPRVHFKGTSRSLHAGWDPNSSSQLTGTVQLTPDGEVRWSTLSWFQGDSRWRSEGVQIGGLRSARGVTGTWFEK